MASDTPIGGRLAPPRFLAFLALLVIGVPVGIATLGWTLGTMAGFDVAALVFLLSVVPLLDDEAHEMRSAARRNDANRGLLLALTAIVTLAVLAAVAGELIHKGGPNGLAIATIIGTLVLSWLFANTIYALHYAHLYYGEAEEGGDRGGLDFPGTDEPDYHDFLYFALTLGMTFQTSDVEMSAARFRRVATGHCLVAFLFNIGVLAFTVNVLGGS